MAVLKGSTRWVNTTTTQNTKRLLFFFCSLWLIFTNVPIIMEGIAAASSSRKHILSHKLVSFKKEHLSEKKEVKATEKKNEVLIF